MKPGTKAGGVRTIEDIRLRCYCDEDTGCWKWKGAFSKPLGRLSEPRVFLADERTTTTLPRASWRLAKGPIKPGHTIWRRCLNHECGNPDHLMSGTKEAWGKWAAKKSYLKGRPERAAINRRIARERGVPKLTLEQAEQIRISPETGRAMAKAYGVSPSAVSRIRLGQSYRQPFPASVFTWRP